MGPIWGRQDPGGPHVGPINFAIWDILNYGGVRAAPYFFNIMLSHTDGLVTRPYDIHVGAVAISYGGLTNSSVWHKGCCCLVHPGVRDKRRVSEIGLSQPRHETGFWWRHNGLVTSQSTDPIKWPNYPLELIGIYVHINTHNKESPTQRCRRSTSVQLCLIFLYISI